MKRTFLIFNPAARGNKARHARDFLYFRAAESCDVVLAPTKTPEEATSLAAQAVRDGFELIVAAGGDGTINEVVNGIGTSGIPLGILPMGTINVFARELGLPLKLDHAWNVLESGTPRSVDLACTESGGAVRYFVQLAGVGLDATSVRETSWELKKKIGPLSYVWAGLKVLTRKNPGIEVISAHPSPAPPCGPAVLVGNGRFYGGPFALFPKAQLDDGLLDVCVFHHDGIWSVLGYLHGVARGTHIRFDDVSYFQAAEFTCQAKVSVPFEVDGELAGEVPVKFSVKPRALNVIVTPIQGQQTKV